MRRTTGFMRNKLTRHNSKRYDLFATIYKPQAEAMNAYATQINLLSTERDFYLNSKFTHFVEVFQDNIGSSSFLDNIDAAALEIPIISEIMSQKQSKTVKGLKKI